MCLLCLEVGVCAQLREVGLGRPQARSARLMFALSTVNADPGRQYMNKTTRPAMCSSFSLRVSRRCSARQNDSHCRLQDMQVCVHAPKIGLLVHALPAIEKRYNCLENRKRGVESYKQALVPPWLCSVASSISARASGHLCSIWRWCRNLPLC